MNMKYHQPLNPSHPPGAGQGPRAGKCILPALGLAAAWLAALPAAHADYTATPVPTVTWGAWDAWGTSLAWMGKAFGNQPDVADVLFGTNATTFNGTSLPGLGLNFVRYNAGACGAGSVNGRSMVILGIPASKQLPGYWLNPTSTNPGSASWDWSVDANQRAMLLNAQALGANRFELFANSPMWWMLDNFDPAGANSGTSDNLNPADTDDFAIELVIIKYIVYHAGSKKFGTSKPGEPCTR